MSSIGRSIPSKTYTAEPRMTNMSRLAIAGCLLLMVESPDVSILLKLFHRNFGNILSNVFHKAGLIHLKNKSRAFLEQSELTKILNLPRE